MTTLYLVVCYDGDKFNSFYGIYQTMEFADHVCNKNNEYEEFHHPNDEIVYKVEQVSLDKSPIW